MSEANRTAARITALIFQYSVLFCATLVVLDPFGFRQNPMSANDAWETVSDAWWGFALTLPFAIVVFKNAVKKKFVLIALSLLPMLACIAMARHYQAKAIALTTAEAGSIITAPIAFEKHTIPAGSHVGREANGNYLVTLPALATYDGQPFTGEFTLSPRGGINQLQRIGISRDIVANGLACSKRGTVTYENGQITACTPVADTILDGVPCARGRQVVFEGTTLDKGVTCTLGRAWHYRHGVVAAGTEIVVNDKTFTNIDGTPKSFPR